MYLLDDRFSTAVAFVEGYNAAFDGSPLFGFHEYVAKQLEIGNSSLHWSYLIASKKLPMILESEMKISDIPAAFEAGLTDLFVDLLESFAAAGR